MGWWDWSLGMICKFSGIGKPGIGLPGHDSGIGVWCVRGWSVGLGCWG